MKIDIKMTKALKHLLSVGVEPAVGQIDVPSTVPSSHDETRRIPVNSIMVANQRFPNHGEESEQVIDWFRIPNNHVNQYLSDDDSVPELCYPSFEEDSLSSNETKAWDIEDDNTEHVEDAQQGWTRVVVMRRKKADEVNLSSEEVENIAKVETHPGLYDDSATGFRNLFASRPAMWEEGDHSEATTKKKNSVIKLSKFIIHGDEKEVPKGICYHHAYNIEKKNINHYINAKGKAKNRINAIESELTPKFIIEHLNRGLFNEFVDYLLLQIDNNDIHVRHRFKGATKFANKVQRTYADKIDMIKQDDFIDETRKEAWKESVKETILNSPSDALDLVNLKPQFIGTGTERDEKIWKAKAIRMSIEQIELQHNMKRHGNINHPNKYDDKITNDDDEPPPLIQRPANGDDSSVSSDEDSIEAVPQRIKRSFSKPGYQNKKLTKSRKKAIQNQTVRLTNTGIIIKTRDPKPRCKGKRKLKAKGQVVRVRGSNNNGATAAQPVLYGHPFRTPSGGMMREPIPTLQTIQDHQDTFWKYCNDYISRLSNIKYRLYAPRKNSTPTSRVKAYRIYTGTASSQSPEVQKIVQEAWRSYWRERPIQRTVPCPIHHPSRHNPMHCRMHYAGMSMIVPVPEETTIDDGPQASPDEPQILLEQIEDNDEGEERVAPANITMETVTNAMDPQDVTQALESPPDFTQLQDEDSRGDDEHEEANEYDEEEQDLYENTSEAPAAEPSLEAFTEVPQHEMTLRNPNDVDTNQEEKTTSEVENVPSLPPEGTDAPQESTIQVPTAEPTTPKAANASTSVSLAGSFIQGMSNITSKLFSPSPKTTKKKLQDSSNVSDETPPPPSFSEIPDDILPTKEDEEPQGDIVPHDLSLISHHDPSTSTHVGRQAETESDALDDTLVNSAET